MFCQPGVYFTHRCFLLLSDGMEFQEADDLLDRVMRSRANDNTRADDAVERATGSRYTEASSYGTGSRASDWYAEGGEWERRQEANPLPHGWEAHQSRSTGQTYYRNIYTDESQYDFPTQPAVRGNVYEREQDEDFRGGAGHEREQDGDYRGGAGYGRERDGDDRGGGRSGRDGDRGGVRGPRSGTHSMDDWGAEPAHDPKGSFLDFDAKGSNLQSSRELFLQQMRASQGAGEGGKKRSRSRKRKRKRSTSSSSSSSSSSRSKKRKKEKKAAKEAAPEDDTERINRIKKAREMRKRNAANDGAKKPDDGGTIGD